MQSNLIKAALFTPVTGGRWGLNLLFWAGPGVAKTSLIEQTSDRYGMRCETLSPSERGEGAFGVVPVPKDSINDYEYLAQLSQSVVANVKKGLTHEEALAQALKEVPHATSLLTYPAPEWTADFIRLGRGVVFVDEITSTPPALMAPLMGLFLARRIGGCVLPKGVRMLAAANPPEIAAAGYDLPMPLANRMGHIDWARPTVEEHTQFMLRGASGHEGTLKLLKEMDEDAGAAVDQDEEEAIYDAEAEEKRVLKAWPEAWARAVGLETSFLQARDLKNVEPKAGDPKASRAFPSDRTWEMATRAYASSIVHGLNESETETFVEAFIGAGAAGEWFTFMQAQDLPNPAQLLDGKANFKHDTTRVDRTVAVLQSCMALIAPKQAIRRKERADALWGILEKMTTDKADLDILIPTVHAMIESDLHSLKAGAKTLAKINPVLRAANIKAGR